MACYGQKSKFADVIWYFFHSEIITNAMTNYTPLTTHDIIDVIPRLKFYALLDWSEIITDAITNFSNIFWVYYLDSTSKHETF